MKRLFLIASFVFSFGIFLAACGGSSTSQPKMSDRVPFPVTSTLVPTEPIVTATWTPDPKQIVDVSGKTCLPEGTYKVTSMDLNEAIINIVCESASRLTVDGHLYEYGTKIEGVLEFTYLEITSPLYSTNPVAEVSISFKDCNDCPRDFETEVRLSRNPLGEWQLSSDQLYFEETPSSVTAKEKRDQERENQFFSQIRVELTQQPEPFDSLLYVPIRILNNDGGFQDLRFLVEMENGKVIEFECGMVFAAEENLEICSLPSGEEESSYKGQNVNILAYSFSIEEYRSEWVYFTQ